MENNIVIILFILSAILVIGGSLIYFAPKFLIRIGESLNKEFGVKRKRTPLFLTDEKVFLNRHIFGPVLVLIGLILLYVSFYLV